VFVLALIAGAFAAALPAGDFKPQWPALREFPRLLIGGLLMGWGAMIALGCTVGVLLSGIMAGALSGWVFFVTCFFGWWAGWRVRQCLGLAFTRIRARHLAKTSYKAWIRWRGGRGYKLNRLTIGFRIDRMRPCLA